MHRSDLSHSDNSIQQKLEAIFARRRTQSKVNWNEGQYLKLLKSLGNPHKNIPPVIHVAGTNGKGSIIAMLRSILEAQGYRVHAYTSPHLIHVNERIILAGQEISDVELERRIDEILEICGDAPLSFFEIVTALAFKAFAETPADITLVEVGMGGRLDCTNIIEKPLVSIISRISLDHTEFLGNTIEDIAREKAGIIKTSVPCVIGYQGDGVRQNTIASTINAVAKNVDSTLYWYDVDWSAGKDGQTLLFQMAGLSKSYPLPSLQGHHQFYNTGAVLAALDLIRAQYPVSDDAINHGLQNIHWRGRMQRLDVSEFISGEISVDADLWLDCGHNDSAGEALAITLQKWHERGEINIQLIVGMLGTKDASKFLMPILPYIKALHIVPISNDPSSQTVNQVTSGLKNIDNLPVYSHDTVIDAIEGAAQDAPSHILVAGSVYLVGEVLAHNGKTPTSMKRSENTK
jgi:dihydrofolate synthase/folylpolyglutamate synthase